MKKKKKVKGERDRTKLQGREKGICGKWGMLACAYGSLLAIRAKNHYTPLGFFGFFLKIFFSHSESYISTRFRARKTAFQVQPPKKTQKSLENFTITKRIIA